MLMVLHNAPAARERNAVDMSRRFKKAGFSATGISGTFPRQTP